MRVVLFVCFTLSIILASCTKDTDDPVKNSDPTTEEPVTDTPTENPVVEDPVNETDPITKEPDTDPVCNSNIISVCSAEMFISNPNTDDEVAQLAINECFKIDQCDISNYIVTEISSMAELKGTLKSSFNINPDTNECTQSEEYLIPYNFTEGFMPDNLLYSDECIKLVQENKDPYSDGINANYLLFLDMYWVDNTCRNDMNLMYELAKSYKVICH